MVKSLGRGNLMLDSRVTPEKLPLCSVLATSLKRPGQKKGTSLKKTLDQRSNKPDAMPPHQISRQSRHMHTWHAYACDRMCQSVRLTAGVSARNMFSRRFGLFLVRTVSQSELNSDVTSRELHLVYAKTGDVRKVMHYHYHTWPDHGVPETTVPIRLLSRLMRSSKVEGPPVVHCSAGRQHPGSGFNSRAKSGLWLHLCSSFLCRLHSVAAKHLADSRWSSHPCMHTTSAVLWAGTSMHVGFLPGKCNQSIAHHRLLCPGIGRTGTFCTVDITLHRLLTLDQGDQYAAEKAVDVKRVVSNLRKQRYGMVQNPQQYLFCHQVIAALRFARHAC